MAANGLLQTHIQTLSHVLEWQPCQLLLCDRSCRHLSWGQSKTVDCTRLFPKQCPMRSLWVSTADDYRVPNAVLQLSMNKKSCFTVPPSWPLASHHRLCNEISLPWFDLFFGLTQSYFLLLRQFPSWFQVTSTHFSSSPSYTEWLPLCSSTFFIYNCFLMQWFKSTEANLLLKSYNI